MKNKTFGLIILLAAAVNHLEGSDFNCCPVWNSTTRGINEIIARLNKTQNDVKCNDHVSCSNKRQIQNLRESHVRIPSFWSLLTRVKNEECKNHLLHVIQGLRNSSPWAIEMFDASSKFPSGLITANTYQFGNFDQCINTFSSENSIKGKYCLADIQFSPLSIKYPPFYRLHMENEFSLDYDPYKSVLEKFKVTKDFTKKRRNFFHSGLCLPDSCDSRDAETILNHFIQSKAEEFGYRTKIQISDHSCTTKEHKPLSNEGKILGLIIVGMFLLVCACTVWDCTINTKGKTTCKLYSYLESFSLIRNVAQFSSQQGEGDMNIFNGMKSLSMILIIMGHRCMASCGGPFFNPQFLEERYRKIQNILLLNGTLIVDTFFLIGGYLTFLILFKQYKKDQRLKLIQIYLYRWLRIAPVYMLVVFFYGHLLEHLGTGPIWSTRVGREAERCRQNWWTNFLFINNYVNTDSLCMFQSWYVACDMHFILLAPFIVNTMVKAPKKGLILLVSFVVGSLLTIFLVTYYNKYDGVLRVYITTFEDLATSFTFNRVYIKTHNRATPYFGGMAAAYVYIKLKQAQYKFSAWQVWTFSTLAVIFALSAICGAWLFYIPGREYNALENALYASFHRLLWAMSMSWIALAGGTKAFGIIQPVLTQKLFTPFSKLSYSAFLVHGAIQMYTSATLRTPEHMSFPKLYWMTGGDVMLSFFLAFLLHIFFEAPLKGIQQLILDKKGNEKNKANT